MGKLEIPLTCLLGGEKYEYMSVRYIILVKVICLYIIRFEVLTAVVMKNSISLGIMKVNRIFGGTCLNFQSRKNNPSKLS
jgi:hypothetical protein